MPAPRKVIVPEIIPKKEEEKKKEEKKEIEEEFDIEEEKPRRRKKTDLIPLEQNPLFIEIKTLMTSFDERIKVLEKNNELPSYIMSLLKSLLEGEVKRCTKWPTKLSNVQAIADYFKIKI